MGLRGPAARTIPEIVDVLQQNSTHNETADCFLWQGHTAGKGYGVICYQGKQIYIHRLIYEYVFGELPNIIRHSCDTPNCWNPDHLHDGTHADNVADKVEKQRHMFGENHYLSKLTEAQVLEIRASQLSPVELARNYNIHRAAIHSILKRESWKHL